MSGWMDGYVDGYNDMEMSMHSRLNGVIMVREVANGPSFECKAINTHTNPTDNHTKARNRPIQHSEPVTQSGFRIEL